MEVPPYFGPPPDYSLAPNPSLYLLRRDPISFDSQELNVPKYVVADKRCNNVRITIERGFPGQLDNLRIFCPPDELSMRGIPVDSRNYWTNLSGWSRSPPEGICHMSFMFLKEEFSSDEDMAVQFETYVKFLDPDVTLVLELGSRNVAFHTVLMTHYDDFHLVHLRGGGDFTLWCYCNSNKINVRRSFSGDTSYLNVKRAR